ncbi:MAG: hypothetical protein ACIAS6_09260 [Phycisphaerales bacterium JB060]
MPLWAWIILAFVAGLAVAGLAWPRVRAALATTPPPDLPEELAPGWYACCSRCGRTQTLASLGGIRLGANRSAAKATFGWCRECKRPGLIRIVHWDRLPVHGGAAAGR